VRVVEAVPQSGRGAGEASSQVRQNPGEGAGRGTQQGRTEADVPPGGDPAPERSEGARPSERAAHSSRTGWQAAATPRTEAPVLSAGQARRVSAQAAGKTSSTADLQNAQWAPGLTGSYAGETAANSRLVRQAAPALTQRVRAAVIRGSQLARRDGRSELTLRLHPPGLGRLKVQVEMRDGELTVRIKAENPDVREALQSQLSSLNRAFRAAEVDVARVEVGTYDPGTSGDWQGGPAAHQRAPQGSRIYEQFMQSETEPPDGWAHFTESGGVDCLI